MKKFNEHSRDSRGQTKRKPFARPTKFPANIIWTGVLNNNPIQFGIPVADDNAYGALKVNGKVIDLIALKDLAAQKTANRLQVTMEDVATVLVEGAVFREPTRHESDGEKQPCTFCGLGFQPTKFPRIDPQTEEEEEGGQYVDLPLDLLKEFDFQEKKPAEYQAAADLTAELLGNEKLPEQLLIFRLCNSCKWSLEELLGRSFFGFSRAAVVDHVLNRDIRISAAIRRQSMRELFGARRKEPQKDQGRRPFNQRRENRNRDRGNQLLLADFFGCRLRADVVEVLNALISEGKVPADPTKALQFINGMTTEQMASMKTEAGVPVIPDANRKDMADKIRYYTGRALEGKKDIAKVQAEAAQMGTRIGTKESNASVKRNKSKTKGVSQHAN